MNNQKGYTTTELIFAICFFLGVVGWCLNIYKLIQIEEFNGMAIVQAIGILVAPLGAILGWIL